LEELKRSAGDLDALSADVTGRLTRANELVQSAVPGKGGFKLPF
jgi:hypothetical protein